MTKVKIGLILIAFLIIGVALPTRYLGNDGGVITTSADLAVHININESLRSGDVFPGLTQDNLGKHSVSKYLPIYHGILGFHILAAALNSVGIPLPGAYALLMDLSLIIVILIGIFIFLDKIRISWKWEYLIALLIFIPTYFNLFSLSTNQAFYSQLLSQALICMAVYCYQKNYKNLGILFFLYASFTYPDFLIWFIPLFLIQKYRYGIIWKPVLLALLVILIWIPLKRSNLAGPYTASFEPTVAIYLLVLFFGFSLWKTNRNLAVICLSFCVGSLVLVLGGMQFLNPSYYAVKISSFSYLLLPFLLVNLDLVNKSKGRIALAILGYLFFISPDLWSKNNLHFFNGIASFSNSDFRKSENVKQELKLMDSSPNCFNENTYLIIDNNSKSELRIKSANAVLRNFDIYSLDLINLEMQKLFKSDDGFGTQFFQVISNQSIEEWLPLIVNTDICLAIPTSQASLIETNKNISSLYRGEDFVYFKPKKN